MLFYMQRNGPSFENGVIFMYHPLYQSHSTLRVRRHQRQQYPNASSFLEHSTTLAPASANPIDCPFSRVISDQYWVNKTSPFKTSFPFWLTA
jgi:hypothetical protein